MDSNVKKGFEFDHARWTHTSGRPMRHVVTKVMRGVVYYRPVDGGAPEKTPVEDFYKIVKPEAQPPANEAHDYLTCSICQHPFAEYGNNAQPVNDGRCCNDCNYAVVVPARLAMMRRG